MINNDEKYFMYLKDCRDIKATYQLALFYKDKQDDIKAFKYFKIASDGGYVDAICQLGYCYQNGIGTEKDKTKTLECFYRLALCYQNGIETNQDYIKAFKYFIKVSLHGHINATYQLGLCYKDGIGTEKDKTKAFEYFKKATDGGNVNATYQLALCYQDGIGTEKDIIKASECFYELGLCYKDGIGTKKDILKATKCFKMASGDGHVDATYQLKSIIEKRYKENQELEIANSKRQTDIRLNQCNDFQER